MARANKTQANWTKLRPVARTMLHGFAVFGALICLLIGFSVISADARTRRQAPAPIDHFEPGSWWIGFQDPNLELMVHGRGAANWRASVHYPGVSLTGTSRDTNPNYLFVNLKIAPDAKPGAVIVSFHEGKRLKAKRALDLRARRPDSASRAGFAPKDAIYLITPDRFANGDPGNDNVKGLREAANRAKPGGRHGGDISGVVQQLDYIAKLGFTQIWLNPLLENDQPEYSYHGYATTDFYKVDPRFGSNEDVARLSEIAGSRNIGLIMDMIVNHAGSEHWWLKDPPGASWINFGGKFSPTSHLHITQMDPHAALVDRRQFSDGWFVEVMPDLNQRNPHLATYLIQNALWWIEYANLSGVRMDTYPYPDKQFMAAWSKRVLAEYPNFTVVGEEWVRNPAMVAYWQRGHVNRDGYVSYLPSLMDLPLQDMMRQALSENEDRQWPVSGLYKLHEAIGNDFIYADPDNLVVFPDNHDMDRIFTQLNGDIDLTKMALGFVACTRGIPQIYYGTEILMENPGTSDHGIIRSDFPGGWTGDKISAITGRGLKPAQADFQEFTRKLLNWRKTKTALHDGDLIHFAPEANDPVRRGTYVFARWDKQGGALIVINKERSAKSLPSSHYAEGLRGRVQGRNVITGETMDLRETISVPARSITFVDFP